MSLQPQSSRREVASAVCPVVMDSGEVCGRHRDGRSRFCGTHRKRRAKGLPLGMPFKEYRYGVPRSCPVLMDDTGLPCGIDTRGRDLCNAHRLRAQRGRPMGRGVRAPYNPEVRDALGRKECRRCREWLTLDNYYIHTLTGRLHARCARCRADVTHNLSTSKRWEILEAQAWKCLCGKALELHGPDTYHVDHDHAHCPGGTSCGQCIRGLLCGRCNWVLGHVGDDPDVLFSLIKYLEAHQA